MNVTTQRAGGFTVIKPEGSLLGESAEAIQEEIGRVVDGGDRRVAVDLSGVDVMDSHGLSCMINAVTRARLREAEVALVGPTPFVAGLLQVTRLDQWFEVFSTVADVDRRFAGEQGE